MFLGYDLLVLAGLAAVALSSPVLYDQRQTGDVNVHVHLKDVEVIALLQSDLFNDSEYDYIYDYADFTIKPSVKPTTSSTTGGSTPEISQKTDVTTETSSSTEKPDVPTEPSSGTTLQASVTAEASLEIDKRIGEVTEPPQNSSVLNNDASGSTSDDTKVPPAMHIKKKEASTLPDEQDEDCISLNLRVGPKIRQLNKKGNEEASGEKTGNSSTESSSQPTKKRCRHGYSLDEKGCCRRVSQRRLFLLPLMMKLAPKVFDDVRT